MKVFSVTWVWGDGLSFLLQALIILVGEVYILKVSANSI